MVFPLKIVIFHSYVKLPEGIFELIRGLFADCLNFACMNAE